MASRNADSMTNAQGEFHPSKPRDEPLTTKGHQVGKMVGNDAAPEFEAQILPPGSAPKKDTYKPNPEGEIPAEQGNIKNAYGGEDYKPDPLDFGASALDSGEVHQGIGKPVDGQSSAELRHDGKSKREGERSGPEKSGAIGGSGMSGEMNAEARKLQEEHTKTGPKSDQEFNTSMTGAEGKESVGAEQVASDDRSEQQEDYLRRGEKGGGLVHKK